MDRSKKEIHELMDDVDIDEHDIPGPKMTLPGAAMAQSKSRRYTDKYRSPDQSIWLIGVEFSKDMRNVVAFEVERG